MDKRLIYPQYNTSGERNTFNVSEDRNWLRKTAGFYHPEIQKYIENSKPIDGLIQVLLTALGASERWGQNVNGDIFREAALKNAGLDYGYKTFESNANYFTHHVNKDPALAKGRVLKAVWNDSAKRVELIVGIDPKLDPDAAKMLDNGEALCFSMGAKLPYDVCSICANQAKTRAEYCDHLRYQINQFDPDSGKLVGAVNPFPKFFDISRVLIPADKTAYMWEKIAHSASPLSKLSSAELASLPIGKLTDEKYLLNKVAEQDEEFRSKMATVNKKAEIHKRILTSNAQSVEKLKSALGRLKSSCECGPEIQKEAFAGIPLNEILSTLAALGVVPTPKERKTLHDLFIGEKRDVPVGPVGAKKINVVFAKRIAPIAEQRSLLRPGLVIQLMSKEASIGSILASTGTGAASAIEKTVETGTAITKGVFSALGAVFGVDVEAAARAERAATANMSSGLAKAIAANPILAGILGGIVLSRLARKSPAPRPGDGIVTKGNFTVADPTRGFYNNDWQRRFFNMQNSPVAVIKTGAAQQLAEVLYGPLVFLTATVDLEKTAEEQHSWDLVAAEFLQTLKSEEFSKTAQSYLSVSSFDDVEHLVNTPDMADLFIIKKLLK